MQKICSILRKSWFKFLLVTAFVLVGISFSNDIKAQHIVVLQYDKWVQYGPTCVGCNSSYFLISRKPYPDKRGFYHSTIYIYSNSFDNNGNLGTTRFNNIKVYAIYPNGVKKSQPLVYTPYFLAHPPQNGYFTGWNEVAYVWSANPVEIYVLEFSSLDRY